jgi:hypothetical protein
MRIPVNRIHSLLRNWSCEASKRTHNASKQMRLTHSDHSN